MKLIESRMRANKAVALGWFRLSAYVFDIGEPGVERQHSCAFWGAVELALDPARPTAELRAHWARKLPGPR